MRAYKTSQGNWQLNFSEHGVQKTLYLGKSFTAASAERVAKVVTEIVACRDRGDDLPADLLRRITDLGQRVRESLERFGLVNCSLGLTLQQLCDRHLKTKDHLKNKTIEFYRLCYQRLFGYFGADCKITEITKLEAEKFRAESLKTLAASSVSRAIIAYRNIFQYAVEFGSISRNPFAKVSAGPQSNEKNQFYVTRELMTKVLGAARDDYDRLVFVLARFAGLRIPCEIRFMKFKDFTGDTFRIHEDTKTGFREVPLFKEIREVFERLKGNPDDLIFAPNLLNKCGAYSALEAAIKRAALTAWPKLFVNCRSSCITDLEELGYSEKVLDAIFGNSARVRKKHYLQLQKEKSYKKVLEDNAAIVEFLCKNGGSFEIDGKEFSLREILGLRDLLVDRFGSGKTDS